MQVNLRRQGWNSVAVLMSAGAGGGGTSGETLAIRQMLMYREPGPLPVGRLLRPMRMPNWMDRMGRVLWVWRAQLADKSA